MESKFLNVLWCNGGSSEIFVIRVLISICIFPSFIYLNKFYRNIPPYTNEVKSGLSQRALAVIQLDESDLARASGHKALLSQIVTSCSGAAQLL